MNAYAIILAGGSGSRMGLSENKVFLPIRGIPAIVRAIVPFSSLVRGVVLVARPQEREVLTNMLRGFGLERLVCALVDGGEDRQASVACGLAALPQDADVVLVHDGARPLVTETLVQRVLASVQAHGSGVAAIPVTDTIKRADENGLVLETLPRSQLYAMQTPQGFQAALLRQAHQKAEEAGYRATDDAALLEYAKLPVHLCAGDKENIKLTTPGDLTLADMILTTRAQQEAEA